MATLFRNPKLEKHWSPQSVGCSQKRAKRTESVHRLTLSPSLGLSVSSREHIQIWRSNSLATAGSRRRYRRNLALLKATIREHHLIVSLKRQSCSDVKKVRCDQQLSLRRRFCGMNLLANHLQTGSGNRHRATTCGDVAGEFDLMAQVGYELGVVVGGEVAGHGVNLAVIGE